MCRWKSPVSIQHVKDPQTLSTSLKHIYFYTCTHTNPSKGKSDLAYITRDGKDRYEMFYLNHKICLKLSFAFR